MMKAVSLALFVVLPSLLSARNECVGTDYLQDQFVSQVGGVPLADKYKDIVFMQVSLALYSNRVIDSSQYLLFVDRNPSVQVAVLLFVNLSNDCLVFVGADKVSTGNPDRRGHFVTPLGFIENSPQNMSYRALGTKNSKGWRGLGAKGSRVWDFGRAETRTKKGDPYFIRLLLHATDPDHGEPRLGRVDSKGCVRISAKLNRFLDYFGVLDAKYENEKRASYALLPKREPTPFPGRFILVGDSWEWN
jgi:hypothetical protein